MPLYRTFETADEIDAEYLPSLAVPDAPAIFERWQRDSERAREAMASHCGVAYGPGADEYLDIFPADGAAVAGGGAPVHLFIHGGYWYRFSARESSWLAPALVRRGITAAILNYALCPAVTIDAIVRETRAALAWLHGHAAEFGGDPANITVSGHSAGGQLTAMALLTDWAGAFGIDGGFLRGGLAISGLFDLAPFPHSSLQQHLRLDDGQIRRNSPALIERAVAAPLVLAVGERESAEFHRQSADYHAHLARLGADSRLLAVPGANHFTVLDALRADDGALLQAVLELCGVG